MIFTYKDKVYPTYLKHGGAAHFIIPFAKEFCIGEGLDIGGLPECHFPGAQIINLLIPDEWTAKNLPIKKYDYIFSSHTLEHVADYIEVLEYWKNHLKKGGILFLYLPHPDMEYWLPQNNRKHKHEFYPEKIQKCLVDIGFSHIFYSERDMYWSFTVVAKNSE